MHNKPDPTETLICWSRQASREPLSDALPVGLATRVLAAGLLKPAQQPWWEYLAMRSAVAGCGVACLCWIVQPKKPPANEADELVWSIVQASLVP